MSKLFLKQIQDLEICHNSVLLNNFEEQSEQETDQFIEIEEKNIDYNYLKHIQDLFDTGQIEYFTQFYKFCNKYNLYIDKFTDLLVNLRDQFKIKMICYLLKQQKIRLDFFCQIINIHNYKILEELEIFQKIEILSENSLPNLQLRFNFLEKNKQQQFVFVKMKNEKQNNNNQNLDLENVNLQKFQRILGLFRQQTNLIDLQQLNLNKIKDKFSLHFIGQKNLKNFNKINLFNIQFLQINSCSLTSYDIENFDFQNLKYLCLKNNKIIDISFIDFKNLVYLDVSSNNISFIKKINFQKIQTLFLNKNKISQISDVYLPEVQYLDLTENPIAKDIKHPFFFEYQQKIDKLIH